MVNFSLLILQEYIQLNIMNRLYFSNKSINQVLHTNTQCHYLQHARTLFQYLLSRQQILDVKNDVKNGVKNDVKNDVKNYPNS